MIKHVMTIVMVLIGCSELQAPKTRRDRRDGIGSDAIAQKKFRSEEFRCADQGLRLATPVTYDDDIKPLLSANCTSCHKSGGTPPDLSNYDKASAAADRALTAISDGSMPVSGALPDEDIDLFAAWVDGGVPQSLDDTSSDGLESEEESGVGNATCAVPTDFEPSSDPLPSGQTPDPDTATPPTTTQPPSGGGATPPPQTSAISYQKDVKPILEAQCVSCHTAGVQNPDLSSYDAAKAAGAKVVSTIVGGSMPPGGPLNQASKDLIKKWQDGGYAQ